MSRDSEPKVFLPKHKTGTAQLFRPMNLAVETVLQVTSYKYTPSIIPRIFPQYTDLGMINRTGLVLIFPELRYRRGHQLLLSPADAIF